MTPISLLGLFLQFESEFSAFQFEGFDAAEDGLFVGVEEFAGEVALFDAAEPCVRQADGVDGYVGDAELGLVGVEVDFEAGAHFEGFAGEDGGVFGNGNVDVGIEGIAVDLEFQPIGEFGVFVEQAVEFAFGKFDVLAAGFVARRFFFIGTGGCLELLDFALHGFEFGLAEFNGGDRALQPPEGGGDARAENDGGGEQSPQGEEEAPALFRGLRWCRRDVGGHVFTVRVRRAMVNRVE